jgi:hypothetical protein
MAHPSTQYRSAQAQRWAKVCARSTNSSCPLYREVIRQSNLGSEPLASSEDSRLKALRYCTHFIHDLNIVSSFALSLLHTPPVARDIINHGSHRVRRNDEAGSRRTHCDVSLVGALGHRRCLPPAGSTSRCWNRCRRRTVMRRLCKLTGFMLLPIGRSFADNRRYFRPRR